MADTSELHTKIVGTLLSFQCDYYGQHRDIADAILALMATSSQAEAPRDELAEALNEIGFSKESPSRRVLNQDEITALLGEENDEQRTSQAEAPEDAEVAAVEKWLHDNPPRALQSRTSQAEAQAPASVDKKRLADIRTRHLAREVEVYGPRVPPFAAFEPSRSMHNDITFLLSCVGAPAPAPTMPTREQIAAAAYRAFRTPHPLQNPPYTSDELKIADAILALFAKGGTP